MTTYATEREFALRAVAAACRLGEAVRAEMAPGGAADALVKADRSPVTVADFGIQALVSLALRDAFPGDPLVAEEDADDLAGPERAALRDAVAGHVRRVVPGTTEADVLAALGRGRHAGGGGGGGGDPAARFWTLDPVDGTKGFLRGGQYAVALALVVGGEVVLGVLGCPALPRDASGPDDGGGGGGARGCLFVAEKGRGARTLGLADGGSGATEAEEREVRVSPVADPARAAFCESVEAAHSSHDQAGAIAARLGVTAPPVRMDSQAKYAAVARGDAAIYLRLPTRADYAEKIWDHAAGCLVVTEAGGQVTDVAGRPLDFSRGRTLAANRGVVATNGALHAQVLAAVRAVLAPPAA